MLPFFICSLKEILTPDQITKNYKEKLKITQKKHKQVSRHFQVSE